MAEEVKTVQQPDGAPNPVTTKWLGAQVAEFARRSEDYLLIETELKQVLEHAVAKYAALAIVSARMRAIPPSPTGIRSWRTAVSRSGTTSATMC